MIDEMHFSERLEELMPGQTQALLTSRMQVADVLRWILGQTGPARVRLSSFSISDEFLRNLYLIRDEGLIRELDLVLDHKATNKTVQLWPMITQVADRCHMSDNHSKVLLVEPESGGYGVAMVTSQNLTRGNRRESAVISTVADVYDTLVRDYEYMTMYHAVPLNELMIDDDE